MRRRTRVSIGVSLAGVALALAVHSPAFSDAYALTNGGFESGATGWAPPIGATLVIDASIAPAEGAKAAHLTSTGAGSMSLASKYWESPEAVPGMTYSLTAYLRDDNVATSAATAATAATARLAVLSATEQILGEVIATLDAGNSASFRTVTTAAVTAPPGAKYLRVTFTAQASGAGAQLSIDGVSITATLPTPTPTPTPTPAPPPPPPPAEEPPDPPPAIVSTPTPTPRATSTPRATATPRVTPTATPTPAPTPAPLPGTALRNANFEQGVAGWSVTRGRLSVASLIDGQGTSLLLTAEDAATAWVQQTVAVSPEGWFAASALLAPLDGIEAAWIRIAWYASDDGSGAQLSTEDSPAVASVAPNALTRAGGYEVVSTGPVRAPAEAHSARVRILLRAATERGATVVIDDVTFEAAEPAEAAPHTPAPAARARTSPAETSTPAPASASRPTAPSDATTPAAEAAPEGAVVAEQSQLPDPRAATAAQRRLRITEVMNNPGEAGADGEFEWIELMNTGTAPAAFAGISLRDRRSGSVLPPHTLDPGAVVVIASPGAHLPDGVPLVRLRRAIGNGLGNAGDRVALVAADGREIDAVAYGEGQEEGEDALPAPGPGQSLERIFSSAGILLDAWVSDTPTPGVPPVPAAARDTRAAASQHGPTTLSGLEGLAPAWAVLVALAGGLLLGVAATRAASIARGRDVEV